MQSWRNSLWPLSCVVPGRKFGAARGLAGDERLAGELDLLVVARRRDDIASRRDEAATRGCDQGGGSIINHRV
jgi:hypothetical protein